MNKVLFDGTGLFHFESYGIDAYGQVTFQNVYGIGSDSEGAVMAHGEYAIDEGEDIQAAGNIQVKGFHSSEYSVQTQYEVTLYEWDVFVDGRADLMAWDMYLNLGARETQSAYHEYFLSVQVEEGQQFMIDQLNFVGNFDTGWYDPFHHELGLSLEGLAISQPYYEPASEDHDEDEEEPVTESEDTGGIDTGGSDGEQDQDEDTNYGEGIANLQESDGTKEKSSGCSTVSTTPSILFAILGLLGVRRKDNESG